MKFTCLTLALFLPLGNFAVAQTKPPTKKPAESVAQEKPTKKPTESEAQKKIWANRFLGKKAPQFLVEKWLSAAPEIKGKFILVDFWATWCGPCREAIPELNTFHKKFGDKLVVIGISDEPESKVRAMKTPVIEYFSAIDTEARTKKLAGVHGIPHCILLDPTGIVRWEGFPLLSGHKLTEKVIADILQKYSPTEVKPAEEKKSEPPKKVNGDKKN